MRDVEAPKVVVTEKHGNKEQVYSHPAYGMLSLSRMHGGSTVLTGSEFTHHSVITLQICHGEVHRDLSSDRFQATDRIVEVMMSEAQWSTFVSSMGVGDGVPCTLSRIGKTSVPSLPAPNHISRLERTISQGRMLAYFLKGDWIMLRSYMLVFVKEIDGFSEHFSDAIILCGNEQEALSFLPEAKANGYPLGVRWVDGEQVRAWPEEGVRYHAIIDLGPHAPLEKQKPKSRKQQPKRKMIRYWVNFICKDGTSCNRTVLAETKYDAIQGVRFLLDNRCVIGFSEGGVCADDIIASEGDKLMNIYEMRPVR
jgi:hypothetical protein